MLTGSHAWHSPAPEGAADPVSVQREPDLGVKPTEHVLAAVWLL